MKNSDKSIARSCLSSIILKCTSIEFIENRTLITKMANQSQQKSPCMKSNDYWLKEFQIKPCAVNLSRTTFSKIGITCSAYSSESIVKLVCHLKQEDVNTFSLRIKHKRSDDSDERLDDNLPKRRKLSEQQTGIGIVSRDSFFSHSWLQFRLKMSSFRSM